MLILKYLKNRFVQFAMFILLAAVCASIDTNLGGAAGIIMATGAAVASTKKDNETKVETEVELTSESEKVEIPMTPAIKELINLMKDGVVDGVKEVVNNFKKNLKLPGEGGLDNARSEVYEKVLTEKEKSIQNSGERRRLGMNRIIRGILNNNPDWVPDELYTNAVEEGDTAKGGTLLPAPMANTIVANLADNNIATRETERWPLSSRTYKVPKLLANATGGWRGEKGRARVDSPSFGDVTFTPHDYALIIPFTEEILSDVDMDLEALVMMFTLKDFDRARDAAFLRGATTADGTIYGLYNRAGLTEKFVNGTNFADLDYDDIIDLPAAIEAQNLVNAKWLMHRTIWAMIKKMKDDQGRYLLSSEERKSQQLEGFPVILSEQAYSTGESAVSRRFVTFGNYKEVKRGSRNEIHMSESNQASIVDQATGETIHLWQQKMKGLMISEKYDFQQFFPNAIAALKTKAA
ncbi:MAG: Phage capsid family protein [Chlorobi bacterium OLB5]|nr:MAG: Phage capsid family protein [Chlorobi bacterium OLB5]